MMLDASDAVELPAVLSLRRQFNINSHTKILRITYTLAKSPSS